MASVDTQAVGMMAPEFRLPAADGGEVRLSEVVRTKRALVVFYRGSWRPVCSADMRPCPGVHRDRLARCGRAGERARLRGHDEPAH
jgi:hypothetical protein